VSYEIVRVQARKVRGSGSQYLLTVPVELIRELGWTKGDVLVARILEVEVDGVKRKALVYYRLQL
jgi:bifunctional DNA-binding transcriptional regulator/antitoxin component of YhaV-PrlF toxin-antitoxin module